MNNNHWRKVGLVLCAAGIAIGVYLAFAQHRPDPLVGAFVSFGIFVYMLNKA